MLNKQNYFKMLIFSGCLIAYVLTSCASSIDSEAITNPSLTPPSRNSTNQPSIATETPSPNPNLIGSNNGMYGRIESDNLPLDEIVKWKTNFRMNVISVASGANHWVILLQESPSNPQEIATISSESLENELTKYITNGKHIVKLVWDDNNWVAIFSDVLGANPQKIVTLPNLTLEEISVAQGEGYFVTDLAYGNDQWVIILTKTDKISDQRVEFVEELGPENQSIPNKDQYLLTTIASEDDILITVMSDYVNYTSQELLISDQFQKDYIQFAWSDGYKNFNVFYVNGKWVHTIWK